MKDIMDYLECGDKKYPIAFTLNIMEEVQEKYGSFGEWAKNMEYESSEPKIKPLTDAFHMIINEGIEIENDENGTETPLLTRKQVNRIISRCGMKYCTEKFKNLIVNSTKDESPKNE